MSSRKSPAGRSAQGASLAACLGLLVLTSACGGASGSGSSVAFASGLPRVPASPAIAKQEQEMFARLNRDRQERGLPALRYDTHLADVARFHSADMRDHRFFEHDSPTSGSLDDRLNAAGYLFLTARENLSEAPDVQTGQDSLLKSPGHYANIISTDITHIGIGVVRGGVQARDNLTITQVFALPGRSESTQAARDAVVGRIQAERASRGLARAERHALLDELSQKHIADLDAETSPSTLQSVGESISKEVTARKNTKLAGVVVGAQLLPDSRSLEVPEALLSEKTARFGLAVRQVKNSSGRPMLQVLLLVAR